MYANSESQKGGYNSYNGGRSFGGRGGRSNWRGKGRGRGNFQAQRDLINRTYDKREIHLISHAFVVINSVIMHQTVLIGYLSYKRLVRRRLRYGGSCELMMHEVVYLN